MFGRRKIATLVAEFLGTGVLTTLVLSIQRSTIGVPFFVALGAGLTVALMVFALGNVSGAHLNPAITFGLWTARKISTLNAFMYIVVQFLGAWGAYYLYTYFVNSSLQPIGGHFTGRILIAEAVGTAIFSFGWASAIYQKFTTATTATVAGLSYMIGIIAASAASIGLVNPALALGVRAWVLGTYVLGPFLGAIVGINLYNVLFAEPDTLVVVAAGTTPGVTSGAAVPVITKIKTAPIKKAAVKKPVARKKATTTRKK